MIARHTPLHRTRLVRKPRRYVVPPEVLAYWEWIRLRRCAVPGCVMMTPLCMCFRGSTIEVAHVGVRGLGQKCNPWEVIPLCRLHHGRGYPGSHHELGKKFWSFHGLDRMGLIRAFQKRYFSLTGIAASRGTGSVRPGGEL